MSSMIKIICNGGPFDGTHIAPLGADINQVPAEQQFAISTYYLLDQSAVGDQIMVTSPYALNVMRANGIEDAKDQRLNFPHKYEVLEKKEDNGGIYILLRYIPTNIPKD